MARQKVETSSSGAAPNGQMGGFNGANHQEPRDCGSYTQSRQSAFYRGRCHFYQRQATALQRVGESAAGKKENGKRQKANDNWQTANHQQAISRSVAKIPTFGTTSIQDQASSIQPSPPDQHKPRPRLRPGGFGIRNHFQFRVTQRRRVTLASDNLPIHLHHQLTRVLIINLPQRRDSIPRAGVEKAAR